MPKYFLLNTVKFSSLKVAPIVIFETGPLAMYELAHHLPNECAVILFNSANLKDEKCYLCAVSIYISLFINEVE